MGVRVVLASVALSLLAPAGHAASVVLASKDAGLAVGQVIADDRELRLPAGAAVTMMTPAGDVVRLVGPYRGAPLGAAAAPADERADARILLRLGVVVRKGHYRPDAPDADPPEPPDTWMVEAAPDAPITFGNVFCVPEAGPVLLWRPDASTADRLVLVNQRTRASVRADWPAGFDTIEWPRGLRFVDGDVYSAHLDAGNSVQLMRIHTVPGDLGSVPRRVAYMAEKGCERQAYRLLATHVELMDALDIGLAGGQ